MKDIKDYLHLYLGCKILDHGDHIRTFVADSYYTARKFNWKPILRKLDSMTRKEKQVVELSADRMNDQNSTIEAFADTTKYLLDKHFDLFGLIDEGLAIDRASLTVKSES